MTERCWHRQMDAWKRLCELFSQQQRPDDQYLADVFEGALEMFALFTGQQVEAVRTELEDYARVWAMP